MSNHDTLIQQMEAYIAENTKFTDKKVKAAALVQELHYKKLEKQLKKDVKK